MVKKPFPSIAVITSIPEFWEDVRRWPHHSFKLESANDAKAPEVLCFGPDIAVDTIRSWRKKFPDATWIWAKENWSVDDLVSVSLDLLPGFFIDLQNGIEIPTIWSRALRARSPGFLDDDSLSKKDLKAAGSRLKNLMDFIQAIAEANDIFELLGQLREEMRSFKAVAEPILLLAKSHSPSQLFYFRGKDAHLRDLAVMPVAGLRVRIHNPEDRQFLANQMGRPFGKVIAFPLAQERSSGWQIQPYIFFEHRMKDSDLPQFIENVAQRLQAVSLALDRLVLESELKRSSLLWEKTFDGIEEPIAIIGLDDELVRSNRLFAARGLKGSEEGLIKIGESIFRVENYDIRIKDQGPVLSTVVHFHDVTTPMNLRERMIQLEKMSAIGHLAGHIAHELNNPLTGIRSLTQFLLTQVKEPQRLREDLSEVEKASQRCQEIILNLLEFSKGNLDSKKTVCDLNEIISKTLPFLKSAIGLFNYKVDFSLTPLLVEVEPHLMQQVVFNLVNNACQALQGDDGSLQIRTFAEGKRAVMSVVDSGPGIPHELQNLIFEPFFTTKQEGQGTGLGLSFSRDFVRRLGGEISCQSEPGKGATFRVILPITKATSLGEAS